MCIVLILRDSSFLVDPRFYLRYYVALFRQDFKDDQFREIKLDATVIKKHLQQIENSGSGWVKSDDAHGFYLIDYVKNVTSIHFVFTKHISTRAMYCSVTFLKVSQT